MTQWNPHAPGTLGLEWMPYGNGSVSIDSNAATAAVSFDQSVSQAIGTTGLFNTSLPIRGGLYAAEWYDNENAVTDTPSWVSTVPNEDVSGTGTGDGQWRNDANVATTIFNKIDEEPPASDYITNVAVTGGVTPGTIVNYTGRVSTAVPSFTGKRILAVRLVATFSQDAKGGSDSRIKIGLNIGGTDYLGSQATISSTAFGSAQAVTETWTYNPATKKPWTIADVQAFDSGDEFVLAPQSFGIFRCYYVSLQVYTCTENRIAVGVLDDTASGLTQNAWNTFATTTPTGGTWTKDASGKHLVVVRRLNATGSMVLPYLTDTVAPPSCANGWTPTLDATYGIVTAMGSAHDRIIPVYLNTTAPAPSADGLPFMLWTAPQVYTGHSIEQEFSGATATNPYGAVKFQVNGQLGNVTADLLVKIKRRSDNVQLGGTLTITRTQIDLLPSVTVDGWKVYSGVLPSAATLAAATQYYVEFTSTARGGNPWSIGALPTAGSGNAATYNGTTDAMTAAGVEDLAFDVPFTLSTVPSAPTNVNVTAGNVAASSAVCCDTGIARAELTWTATALGAAFLRYEIERSEDTGVTWEPVAYVLVEAVHTWEDYELRRGVPTSYRVRVVRTDGVPSSWAVTNEIAVPTWATGYLALTSGDFATSPDAPPLGITGDIDLRVRGFKTIAGNDIALSKAGSDGFQSYYLAWASNDSFTMFWTLNGSTDVSASSTSTAPFTLGKPYWVRATLAVATGTVKFYWAPDSEVMPTVWTQLGADVVVGATSIFDSTAPVIIGGWWDNGVLSTWDGGFYRAQIRNGINGTVVFDADFSRPASGGAGGLTDAYGNTITFSGNARWVQVAAPSPVVAFVSNYDPVYNLVYDYRPTRRYQFLEADEAEHVPIYGRDFQMAFLPLENRGVVAEFPLILAVDDAGTAAGGGWDAFTDLRNLARAPLPYVCALDHYGNRLYSTLSVPQGNQENADLYLSTVQATQITGEPYIVKVAS